MLKLKAFVSSDLFIVLYFGGFFLLGIFYNLLFLVLPFAIPGLIYCIAEGLLEIKEKHKKYDYID